MIKRKDRPYHQGRSERKRKKIKLYDKYSIAQIGYIVKEVKLYDRKSNKKAFQLFALLTNILAIIYYTPHFDYIKGCKKSQER